MKKLLVLLMVLGLVSSAQASLSLSLSATTVAVNGTVTAGVVSTDDSAWIGDFVLSEDLSGWTTSPVADYVSPVTWSFIKTAGTGSAGDSGSATVFPGYANVWTLGAGGITVLPSAGTQFSISIKGTQAGTIYISLQQDADPYPEISTNGPLTLTVTPEPMTLALLGLGGLFLRRRK